MGGRIAKTDIETQVGAIISDGYAPIGSPNRYKYCNPNSDKGSDDAFRQAIDVLDFGRGRVQGIAPLERGYYSFDKPVEPGKSIIFSGQGTRWGTTLRPSSRFVGDALCQMLGKNCVGDWSFFVSFRDLSIDCMTSQKRSIMALRFEQAYSCSLSNLRIDVATDATAVQISGCNHIRIDPGVVVYGKENEKARGNVGFQIDRSTVVMFSPDIEWCKKPWDVDAASKVDIYSPYLEWYDEIQRGNSVNIIGNLMP